MADSQVRQRDRELEQEFSDEITHRSSDNPDAYDDESEESNDE